YELLSNESAVSGFVMDEIEGVCVEVEKVAGNKCNRCWKFTQALNDNQICDRCEEVIQ
ncbi:uncharacterized protein METZ01_LOCUS390750, partial [marine metagenome]